MEQNKAIPPMVCWVYPDPLLGGVNVVPRLEVTRELRCAGWRVTLLAPGPHGPHDVKGVEVYGIERPDVYFFRQVVFHFRALSYIRKNWHNIDIIFFHQYSLPYVLLLKLKRFITRETRPLLVMDTRTVPMEAVDRATVKAGLRGAYYNLMNALANRFVDGQTAITRRMVEAVHIPPARLWGVWPSGVNLERFEFAQVGRSWPGPRGPVRIIYIGSLSYERGILQLCKAGERANREGMRFQLIFVGDGSARRELEEIACRTKDRIRYIHPVQSEHIPDVLNKAHIGVLPFPDKPNFRVSSPVKLFEYMGAGLPVLATRIACHTDVIGAEPFVFWAEGSDEEALYQALRSIWQSRSLLSKMGAASAQAARAWTWERSAGKLRSALEFGLAQSRDNRDHNHN